MSTDQIKSIAQKAPHWAALVLVVGAFLVYLDRAHDGEDLVQRQRIDQCHAVQERANDILARLDATLTAHTVEDAKLRSTIREFERTLDEHTKAVDRLLLRLEGGR